MGNDLDEVLLELSMAKVNLKVTVELAITTTRAVETD